MTIKENLHALFVAVVASLFHMAPMIAIVLIATEGKAVRVYATALLFFSSLVLGYFHGLNRTLDRF